MKITGCFVLCTLLQLSALWPQLSFSMLSLSLTFCLPNLSLWLSWITNVELPVLTSKTAALCRLGLHAPHLFLPWRDRAAFKIDPLLGKGRWGALVCVPSPFPHPTLPVFPCLTPSLHTPRTKWVHARRPVCAFLCVCVHISPRVTAAGIEGQKSLAQWLGPPLALSTPPCFSW